MYKKDHIPKIVGCLLIDSLLFGWESSFEQVRCWNHKLKTGWHCWSLLHFLFVFFFYITSCVINKFDPLLSLVLFCWFIFTHVVWQPGTWTLQLVLSFWTLSSLPFFSIPDIPRIQNENKNPESQNSKGKHRFLHADNCPTELSFAIA